MDARQPDPTQAQKPREWVTRMETALLIALLALFLLAMAAMFIRQRRAGAQVRLVRGRPAGAFQLNPNTASQSELELLPRVGASRAKRILKYRESHGRFADLEEFRLAAGLTPDECARVAPWLVLDEADPPETDTDASQERP